MKILITYATVSGNSAMLTQQLHDNIKAAHPDFELVYKDVDDCRGEDYAYDLIIMASSTWDEGNMNIVAEEYMNQLQNVQGKKFALIGLGDSSYEHFCTGVDKIAAKLGELGAQVVGDLHRVDGFIEDSIVAGTTTWAEGIIAGLGAGQAAAATPATTPTASPTADAAAPAAPTPAPADPATPAVPSMPATPAAPVETAATPATPAPTPDQV